MPKNLLQLDLARAIADELKDVYTIQPAMPVQGGAKAKPFNSAKNPPLNHYIFYQTGWMSAGIRRAIDKWDPNEIEYKKTNNDKIESFHIMSCTDLIESWNSMGKGKRPIPKKNPSNPFEKQEYEEINIPIGIVVIILHGDVGGKDIYISKNYSAEGEKRFAKDMNSGKWKTIDAYTQEDYASNDQNAKKYTHLVFPSDEISKLQWKKIQTLIVLCCFGGKYEVDNNIAKNFLAHNAIDYALAVDCISGIHEGKDKITDFWAMDNFLDSPTIKTKGYVFYPNGKEKLTNKKNAENFEVLCNLAHGK